MTDWTPDGAEVRDWASWDAEHQGTYTKAAIGRSAGGAGSDA